MNHIISLVIVLIFLMGCTVDPIDGLFMDSSSQSFSITTPAFSSTTEVVITWQKLDSASSYVLRVYKDELLIASFNDLGSTSVSSDLSSGVFKIEVYARINGQLVAASNSGKTLTVDPNPWTLTLSKENSQERYTDSLPIQFSLVSSRAVNTNSIDVSDIQWIGSASGLIYDIQNTGDDKTFTINVTSISVEGTLEPQLQANTIRDTASQLNPASENTNNWVNYSLAPRPVKSFTVLRKNQTELRAEWIRGDSSTTGFKLTLSTGTPAADCSSPTVTKAGNEYFHEFTGLTANTDYYITLCAVNAASDSQATLRTTSTFPQCDVSVSVNTSNPATLTIPAAKTPGGASDLTLTANTNGLSGNYIRFEIVDGGATGTATSATSGSGIFRDPYRITVTAFDDSSSNDDIIAAVVADATANSLVTVAGSDATDGIDPETDPEYLLLGYTFSEFQTILDTAETNRATHTAADSKITICLDDNLTIMNSSSRDNDGIVIPGNDFHIVANLGNKVIVQNDHADDSYGSSDPKRRAFLATSRTNLGFANLTILQSKARYGHALIFEASSSVNYLSNINIIKQGTGYSNQGGVAINNSSVSEISKLSIATQTWHGWGLYLIDSNVDKIFNLSMGGPQSRSILQVDNSTVSEISDLSLEVGRAGSSDVGSGLFLHNNSRIGQIKNMEITMSHTISGLGLSSGASIGLMEDFSIRRKQSDWGTENTEAIFSTTDTGYFETENINRGQICTEQGAAASFEDHSINCGFICVDGVPPSSITEPTPYPEGLGLETFPFSDLSISGDQNIKNNMLIGGTCALNSVTGLTNTATTSNSISMSWTATSSGRETAYRVGVSKNWGPYVGSSSQDVRESCTGSEILIPEGSFTGTAITITGLEANTEYSVRVCPVNEDAVPIEIVSGQELQVTTAP